jgi:hypothetical protein
LLGLPTLVSLVGSHFSPCFANTACVDIPYRKKCKKKGKNHVENLRYIWLICIRESKNSFKKAAFDSFS